MSYDLLFWRDSSPSDDEPEWVAGELDAGRRPAHVASLPVEDVVAAIVKELGNIEVNRPSGGPIQLIWTAPDSSDCFICVPFDDYILLESHGATADILNRVLDVAHGFGCRLYDPQANTRYA
jgi:hypothetical protein